MRNQHPRRFTFKFRNTGDTCKGSRISFFLCISKGHFLASAFETRENFLLEEENEKMEKLRHEKIAFLFFSCYLRTFENRERQRQGTFMLPLMFSRSIHSYNDSINFNLCCDVDSACWLQSRSSTGERRTDTHAHGWQQLRNACLAVFSRCQQILTLCCLPALTRYMIASLNSRALPLHRLCIIIFWGTQ